MFMLGFNKIANYADLTKDIKDRLSDAKNKAAEKWIESY